MSQSRLARLSGVSRFRLCTYELGGGSLSPEDLNRLQEALQAEAERLRSITAFIRLQQADAVGGCPNRGGVAPGAPAESEAEPKGRATGRKRERRQRTGIEETR